MQTADGEDGDDLVGRPPMLSRKQKRKNKNKAKRALEMANKAKEEAA